MEKDHSTSLKKMTYGSSGLKVSRIILGLLSYGSSEWAKWVLEEEEGIRHIKAAYDTGIQTFDTSNMYSNGESERILGKAIKQHNLPRDEIVYAPVARNMSENLFDTKDADQRGYVNQYGLSRKHIFDSIKRSLERLQLDYVDVLQFHRIVPNTPIAETMQALHDVVKAGYARYIGASSCYAYQFHAMQNYAINNNLTPFISMQNLYNLISREEEREMIPTLEMFGVGMIPWAPLAQGILARPLGKSTHRFENDKWMITFVDTLKTNTEVIKRIEETAKSRNISMAQVAMAWCLSKDYVTAPIVGTTKLDNLWDITGAIHIKLTEDEIRKLEEAYVTQAPGMGI